MNAIESKDLGYVASYAKDGKDLSFYYHDGFTPLTYAVKGECNECVRIFLENEVKVNQLQKGGLSAVAWAVFNNDKEMVSLLISHGAEPNLKCDGSECMNALDVAEKYQRDELIEIMK